MKHHAFSLFCLAILMSLSSPACANPVVQLPEGSRMEGLSENGVDSFRGVRYAQPPVGNLRWRPPVEYRANSQELVQAHSFGSGCTQPDSPSRYTKIIGSEDCLFLNVWRPSGVSSDKKLPVMVFIYGGAYIIGSTSIEYGTDESGKTVYAYEGANLARDNNVVFVTMNYRVGTFGFLAHSGLSREAGYHGSGNYGFLDQVEALRWIQRNIGAFGGDPGKVMIYGTSAGGSSVSSLVASPLAKGLFSRAIIQSSDGPVMSLEKSEENGVKLSKATECDIAGDEVACLRAKSTEEIANAVSVSVESGSRGVTYGPTIDHYFLPKSRLELLASPEHNDVPTVVLVAREEFSWVIYPFFPNLYADPLKTDDQYHTLLRTTFGEAIGDGLFSMYPSSQYRSPQHAFEMIFADLVYNCAARQLARALVSSQKSPVWRTVYSYVFENEESARYRGAHGFSDLLIFRNNLKPPSAKEQAFAKEIGKIWADFADTGVFGTPSFPSYESAKDNYVSIDSPIQMESGFRTEQCDIIDQWGL